MKLLQDRPAWLVPTIVGVAIVLALNVLLGLYPQPLLRLAGL